MPEVTEDFEEGIVRGDSDATTSPLREIERAPPEPSSGVVPPTLRCEDVYHLFANDPTLEVLAVLRGDKPIGIVGRQLFLVKFATQYGWSLYANRPITRLM